MAASVVNQVFHMETLNSARRRSLLTAGVIFYCGSLYASAYMVTPPAAMAGLRWGFQARIECGAGSAPE